VTRLRYTGPHPIVFIEDRVGHVEPGEEFEVRDDLAPRFLARPDIETVNADQAVEESAPARRTRTPKTAPEGE
jgi:hypothetical protein